MYTPWFDHDVSLRDLVEIVFLFEGSQDHQIQSPGVKVMAFLGMHMRCRRSGPASPDLPTRSSLASVRDSIGKLDMLALTVSVIVLAGPDQPVRPSRVWPTGNSCTTKTLVGAYLRGFLPQRFPNPLISFCSIVDLSLSFLSSSPSNDSCIYLRKR